VLLTSCAGEQALVHLEQALDGDLRSCAERLDCPVHRLDVVQDLGRGDVGTPALETLGKLCLQQPARADLQSLDLGRCDRLG